MKKIIFTLLLALCSVSFSACNRKQAALDRFEAFTEEISQNGRNYSVEEWEEAEIQYEELTDDLDSYEYTAAERRKIARLKSKCLATYAKRKVGDVIDIFDQVKGSFDEFKGNYDSDNDDSNY